MIRTIFSIAILASFTGAALLHAEPPSKKPAAKTQTKNAPRVPAAPLKTGWSLENGVWTHPDGYKFVGGQVVRTGTQTHKKPPKPPTKAEMDAVTKKTRAPQTPDDIKAARNAEKQRNLRPIPTRQTGTNL
ncbi:MAG TPA: hypothetical protein VM940_17160 [Chthoniobacterales bacterium]|jgi:hypothetical protein|nr:hypothetical protein [Chthoniobacterales bacterium]